MSRYIDAESAKAQIKNYGKQAIDSGRQALDPVDDIVSIVGILESIPFAEVQEICHAYWKKVKQGGDPEAVCSRCGREVVYQIIEDKWEFENFCPHCGAEMEGKVYGINRIKTESV